MGQIEILQILERYSDTWMSAKEISNILKRDNMPFSGVAPKLKKLRKCKMLDYNEILTARGNGIQFTYRHKPKSLYN